jgi:hypothetical protein
MACKRVRVNATYYYVPVMIDKLHPPIAVGMGRLAVGDKVKVVNLPGCPRANTMGHCHFTFAEGEFGGLCHVNSLLTREEYIDHLKRTIAVREAEMRDTR